MKHAGIHDLPHKVRGKEGKEEEKTKKDVDVFEVAAWKYDPKYKCYDIMINHIIWMIVINTLTCVALFSDDVRILFFRLQSDIYFDILAVIMISLFTLEIYASTKVIEGYYRSFFMYLDIVSTLSLVFDL